MSDVRTEDGQSISTIKALLSQKKFSEALALSTALTEEEPGNAEAWWRRTLAASRLGLWADAQIAVKEAIALMPRAPLAWSEYGDILRALGQKEEGRKALEQAIKLDPSCHYAHSRLFYICDEVKDFDGVVRHGQALETLGKVDATILDKLALALWHKNDFHRSLHYYTVSANLAPSATRYSNLGILYERPEVARYLDASDAYRRALHMDAKHERAVQSTSRLAKTLVDAVKRLRSSGTHILEQAEFYRFYINPFVLLGCQANENVFSYTQKDIQKLKKILVQEIDLEDGRIGSLDGHLVDKSRALGICDELLNDDSNLYHATIFDDKRLCAFLQKGDTALFTYDESYFPIETLALLDDDPSFPTWLSDRFSRQYDLVLSRALEQNNLSAVTALLSGRRYVIQKHEDLCFSGANRFLDLQMERLRKAEQEASTEVPSVRALSAILLGKTQVNEAAPLAKLLPLPDEPSPALAPLLSLLPEYFKSFQIEAARLIRSIAIDCYNKHSDADLASEILKLAQPLEAVISVEMKGHIEGDKKRLKEILAEESKKEVRLLQAGEKLQITREGVRKGSAFVSAKHVKGVRWGITVQQNSSFDCLVSVISDEREELVLNWTSQNQEHYSQMLDALLSFVYPSALEKINKALKENKSVVIGNCELTRLSLVISVSGFFSQKRHEVPWEFVETEFAQGALNVFHRLQPNIKATLPMRTTYNAAAIRSIALSQGKSQ